MGRRTGAVGLLLVGSVAALGPAGGTSGQAEWPPVLAPGFVDTVVGTGVAPSQCESPGPAPGAGGPASAAPITGGGVATDAAGNLYLSDDCYVRRVDVETGLITTIAGNGTNGGAADGLPGLDVGFTASGIGVDDVGNVFIADESTVAVIRIDTAGVVEIVFDYSLTGVAVDRAGVNVYGITDDLQVVGTNLVTGAALGVVPDDPLLEWTTLDPLIEAIAVAPDGDVLMADARTNRVLRVDPLTGQTDVVAGRTPAGDLVSGFGPIERGFDGDGLPATDALLDLGHGAALGVASNGDVFVLDQANARLRKVDAETGIIDTIVGTGTHGYSGDGGPGPLAEIGPIASAAKSLAVDQHGNVFFPDGNRVRRVAPAAEPVPGPSCAGLAATIVGTGGPDVLLGTAGDDVIVGRGGDDTIDGRGGSDTICGGAGDDVIDGGPGADVVRGGAGDDEIDGSGGSDDLRGGQGQDIVRGGAGGDVVRGGAGDDDLDGGGGDDDVRGGGGADEITGGGGNDDLRGGAGNDDVRGGRGDDTVRGGADDDVLRGGTGNDIVLGGGGVDEVRGGAGDDILDGGGGPDLLRGGAGNDILTGGGSSDDLRGNEGDDLLFGENGGANALDGGAGTDICDVGAGGTVVNCDGSRTAGFVEDIAGAVVLSALDNPLVDFDVATEPSHGALSGSGSTLLYTPDRNRLGPDVFTFTATYDGLTSAEVAVMLTVGNPECVAVGGSGALVDSGQLIGSSSSQGLALADVDGDGALDIFAANTPNPNEIWLNDLAGGFPGPPLPVEPVGDPENTLEVAFGDLDGDGDVDAFLANGFQTNPNNVWLGDGSGAFVAGWEQTTAPRDSRGVELRDLDGDGDLDAFVVNEGAPDAVWLNDGTATFTEAQLVGTTEDGQDLSLGDLDGDGDVDAVVANGSLDPSRVLFNDGSGFFTIDPAQALGTGATGDVELGDLDADGDLDLFVANAANQPNVVYLNDGAGMFTSTGQVLTGDDSFGVELGDLDGDTDLDAFVVNTSNQANVVLENDGTGTFASVLSLGVDITSTGIELGDVDADCDLDAVVVNYGSPTKENQVYVNP